MVWPCVRIVSRLAAAAALAGTVAFVPAVAFAIDPGGFVATDGNMAAVGQKDWDTFLGDVVVGKELFTGQQDTSFGEGTKSDSPIPTVVDGGIPRNKSDFDRFYMVSEVLFDADNVVNNVLTPRDEVLFYVAWIRNNTLGTANFNIELNQSSAITTNGVTPVRTAGDILITFDFASGGNTVNLGLLHWLTVATGGTCFANNSFPCWGDFIDLDAAGFAEGGVNFQQTIVDQILNYPGGPNVNILDSRFGEAAINLTDAGVLSADQCSGFATAYVTSRSSDSFTSAVKDFIAPEDAPFNLCGSIKVQKVDDNGDSINGAVFYLYPADGPSDTVATDDVAGEPLDSCTITNGSCTFNELNAGSYWVVEVQGIDGYCLPNPAFKRVDLASQADVTVDFTDFRIFTIITLVCEGDSLVASEVTLDGETHTSLGTATNAAALCALTGARFERVAGTYSGQVVIPVEDCATPADDDGDGLINGADPDCTSDASQCVPEDCDNNVDDDGDILVDCDDPDCACP